MEFEALKKVTAAVLGMDPDEIEMDMTFLTDLGADSLDLYQIFMGVEDELDEIGAKAEQILAERQCLTLKDLAVDGRDVIAAGVKPGPEVGRILDGALGQVLNGEAPNERSALLHWIARSQNRERK